MGVDLSGFGNMMSGIFQRPATLPPGQVGPQTQGGLGGQFLNWAEANPNQFTMALDMIGQGFDPNNPAAGVGTGIAQGNMLTEAQQAATVKQEQKTKDWKAMLKGILDGTGNPTVDGIDGVTSFNHKIQPNGKWTFSADGNGGVQNPAAASPAFKTPPGGSWSFLPQSQPQPAQVPVNPWSPRRQ